jgi:hypothetical protein
MLAGMMVFSCPPRGDLSWENVGIPQQLHNPLIVVSSISQFVLPRMGTVFAVNSIATTNGSLIKSMIPAT